MTFSFHCNCTTGHLRMGKFCFRWRNALPRHSLVYISHHDWYYGSFGLTIISWDTRTKTIARVIH